MDQKRTFAISFIPEVINDNIILLKPHHIVEGSKYNSKLINNYEEVFNPIVFTNELTRFNRLYGFGVTEREILDFANKYDFPDSIKESADICAKLYLNSIQQYIFLIEKRDKKTMCFAINLNNKSTNLVDINKSGIPQLIESTINYQIEEPNKQEEKKDVDKSNSFINRKKLINKITKRVVGQDEAAIKLVHAICDNQKYGHYENKKINVLLYGPTGCGKTELVRSLSKELDIPFIEEDMTGYTASGYVGDSIKKILRRLFYESGKDLEKAEHGIVVLDEIDKLASNDPTKSVNTTEVQQELLKVLEGCIVDLNDSNKTVEQFNMDTSHITFILCGAFSKFKPEKKNRTIGFNQISSDEETKFIMTNKDLVEYGLLPEFIGRIKLIMPINPLKKKDFEQILLNSSISSLKIQEKAFLNEDNVRVVYDDKYKFISGIATKAEELGVGVRGLQTVVEEVFQDAKIEINEATFPIKRELLVTSEMLNNSKCYKLKKVKRGREYELSKGNGERVKKYNK